VHQYLPLGQILVLFPSRVQHLLAVRLQDGEGVALRLREIQTPVAAAQVVVVVAAAVVVVVTVEILHESLGQRGLGLDVVPETGIVGISHRATAAGEGRGAAVGAVQRGRRGGLLRGRSATIAGGMTARDVHTVRSTLVTALGAVALVGRTYVAGIAVQVLLQAKVNDGT